MGNQEAVMLDLVKLSLSFNCAAPLFSYFLSGVVKPICK